MVEVEIHHPHADIAPCRARAAKAAAGVFRQHAGPAARRGIGPISNAHIVIATAPVRESEAERQLVVIHEALQAACRADA